MSSQVAVHSILVIRPTLGVLSFGSGCFCEFCRNSKSLLEMGINCLANMAGCPVQTFCREVLMRWLVIWKMTLDHKRLSRVTLSLGFISPAMLRLFMTITYVDHLAR